MTPYPYIYLMKANTNALLPFYIENNPKLSGCKCFNSLGSWFVLPSKYVVVVCWNIFTFLHLKLFIQIYLKRLLNHNFWEISSRKVYFICHDTTFIYFICLFIVISPFEFCHINFHIYVLFYENFRCFPSQQNKYFQNKISGLVESTVRGRIYLFRIKASVRLSLKI